MVSRADTDYNDTRRRDGVEGEQNWDEEYARCCRHIADHWMAFVVRKLGRAGGSEEGFDPRREGSPSPEVQPRLRMTGRRLTRLRRAAKRGCSGAVPYPAPRHAHVREPDKGHGRRSEA